MILTAGQVLQTYAGSCGFALMMTGHQRAYAWLLGISTIITIGLDVAFFNLWGNEGIAIATALSLTVQNYVQAGMLRRLTGFHSIASVRLAMTEGLGTVRKVTKRGGSADAAGAAATAASGGPGELEPEE